MSLNAHGVRVVMRQCQEIQENPVADVSVLPAEDLHEIKFEIDGPEGTPYEAGRFSASLVFEEQYPDVPPKGYFRTRIFHPNVSEKGAICVNALKKDWRPDMGLRHILQVIRCLLVEPNAESALNEEAGRLLLEDYATFEKKAIMFTRVHALRPAGATRFPGPETDATYARPSQEDEAFAGLPSCSQSSNVENSSSVVPSNNTSGSGLRNLGENTINAVGNGKEAAADKMKKKTTEKKKTALKRI